MIFSAIVTLEVGARLVGIEKGLEVGVLVMAGLEVGTLSFGLGISLGRSLVDGEAFGVIL